MMSYIAEEREEAHCGRQHQRKAQSQRYFTNVKPDTNIVLKSRFPGLLHVDEEAL